LRIDTDIGESVSVRIIVFRSILVFTFIVSSSNAYQACILYEKNNLWSCVALLDGWVSMFKWDQMFNPLAQVPGLGPWLGIEGVVCRNVNLQSTLVNDFERVLRAGISVYQSRPSLTKTPYGTTLNVYSCSYKYYGARLVHKKMHETFEALTEDAFVWVSSSISFMYIMHRKYSCVYPTHTFNMPYGTHTPTHAKRDKPLNRMYRCVFYCFRFRYY